MEFSVCNQIKRNESLDSRELYELFDVKLIYYLNFQSFSINISLISIVNLSLSPSLSPWSIEDDVPSLDKNENHNVYNDGIER